MNTIELHPSVYQPTPPEDKEYGIGFIGCGRIVQKTHLPAYEKCGYTVVAACDLDSECLKRAQERFGIPQATSHIEEILGNERVQIIDRNYSAPLKKGSRNLRSRPKAREWAQASRSRGRRFSRSTRPARKQ